MTSYTNKILHYLKEIITTNEACKFYIEDIHNVTNELSIISKYLTINEKMIIIGNKNYWDNISLTEKYLFTDYEFIKKTNYQTNIKALFLKYKIDNLGNRYFLKSHTLNKLKDIDYINNKNFPYLVYEINKLYNKKDPKMNYSKKTYQNVVINALNNERIK